MKLSRRALNFLERGGRTIDPPDPLVVGQKLLDAGMPAFDANIESLVEFGGYWHPLGATGTFKIFTVDKAIASSGPVRNSDDPEEFRIGFGHHPTAQFSFNMDGHGRIYADDIPIHDSATEWIENYSIVEMVERWKNCIRVVLPDPPGGFASWAGKELRPEAAASGKVSRWWLGPEWALQRFRPWVANSDEYWIWLFATNKANADLLSSRFTSDFGLEPLEITEWP